MRYHVVLRGPRSDEPGADKELAAAIASRYGVPVEAISDRLKVGGFRVKTDVDLDTAMSYAVDLTKLGGACVVVDAETGETINTKAPAPAPASPAPSGPVGLAAAGAHGAELGALDAGQLVVSTLDGQIDGGPVSQPGDLVLALDNDAPLALDSSPYEPSELAAPSGASDDFAPPPSDVADEDLLLADDPRDLGSEQPERKPIVLPEPTAQAAGARAPGRAGPGIGEQINRLASDARESLADRGRVHIAAGALLAVVLGFVAAHVIGVIQETSAFAPVHKELRESYAEATDPDAYAALPQIREGMQALIDSRKRRIAVTSGLVWLATGAGVWFLWFRKIDWSRLAKPGASQSG